MDRRCFHIVYASRKIKHKRISVSQPFKNLFRRSLEHHWLITHMLRDAAIVGCMEHGMPVVSSARSVRQFFNRGPRAERLKMKTSFTQINFYYRRRFPYTHSVLISLFTSHSAAIGHDFFFWFASALS